VKSGEGKKLLPGSFFPVFRLAVVRVNQPGKKKYSIMNKSIQSKRFAAFIVSAIAVACFGLLPPNAFGVVPAPDGGYPAGNTAEGQSALFSLTTGGFNTAVGYLSLRSSTTSSFNTALGAGALLANTGDYNTATGAGALLSNTNGSGNTANGVLALFSNTTGVDNTAIGVDALLDNTDGDFNTAVGSAALLNNNGNGNTAVGGHALIENTSGEENTAVGGEALFNNIDGNDNTAIGGLAMQFNTSGGSNTAVGGLALRANTTGGGHTAVGFNALLNATASSNFTGNTAVGFDALMADTTGNANVAVGLSALIGNTTGGQNTALGWGAGAAATTGDGNVYIGAGMAGAAGEANHTYIRNINNTTVSGGGTDTITVNLATGLLGHLSSSRRYKEDVKPMDNASEAVYRLVPVTYRYKREIDATQSPAFGLIAEDVAEVDPNLVARNSKGQPESVHYEMVNAMLLNEFLKAHRKMEQQEAIIAELKADFQTKIGKLEETIAQQRKEMEAVSTHVNKQAAQIDKVNAQLEKNNSAGQVVASDF